MSGWGQVFGWVFDRLPNKKEFLRNSIDNIKKEMNEIQSKPGLTARDADKYMRLSDELSKKIKQLENI